MVRWCRVVAVGAALLASAASAFTAQPRQDPHSAGYARSYRSEDEKTYDATVQYVPGAYIVELEGGVSPDAIVEELQSDDLDVKTRVALPFKLFNGVSIDIGASRNGESDASVEKIAAKPGVKQVWPVRRVSAPRHELVTTVSLDDLASVSLDNRSLDDRAVNSSYNPHGMTQIDRLHEAGFTGKGIRIAVVDSGIDYTHPLLGGCFGPGCVVTHGYNAVPSGSDVDFDLGPEDPMDCFGHGTQVAGIIAAQPNDFGFVGAAPDASFGAYRVIGCNGYGYEEWIINAMLRAFEDGNDIMTLSLGLEDGWPGSPMSVVAERIITAGIPVIVAYGNQGDYGLFASSTPGSGRGVGAVASYDPEQVPRLLYEGLYSIGERDTKEFPWSPFEFGQVANENATMSLFHLERRSETIRSCPLLPEPLPDLTGVLVLIEFVPGCFERERQQSLLNQGATRIMYYGEDDAPPTGFSVIWDSRLLVMGSVGASQARIWLDALKDGLSVTISITNPKMANKIFAWSENTDTGGFLAGYSSLGPNWDLSAGPSFGAPGSDILTTHLAATDSYAILSGTSLAAPLVAGAAALLSQARGIHDPATLHRLLSSTARQTTFRRRDFDWGNIVDIKVLAPVPGAGAGLIQLWDAVNAQGLLNTSSISFNDTDNHVAEASFSILNTGSEAVTYILGHSPALTAYGLDTHQRTGFYRSVDVVEDAVASLAFGADSVTVAAGRSAEITVRCQPPTNVDKSRWPIYSGYVTLNGTNGENLVLSYLGNAGSMKNDGLMMQESGTYLTVSGNEFGFRRPPDTVVRIARPNNTTALPPDYRNEGFPVALASMNKGGRALRFDIVPMTNSTAPGLRRTTWLGYQSLGQIWGSPHLLPPARWQSAGAFAGVLGDMTVVPEGRYRIIVSALKMFCDTHSTMAEDWEVAELVPFILEYTE